jgi:hypothetical protein
VAALTTLTVSIEGTVQLGSLPATPDNLREWFMQCVSKFPSLAKYIPREPEVPAVRAPDRGEEIDKAESIKRMHPEYRQFQRWLARAPLISQAEVDAMEPVTCHGLYATYEETLKAPWLRSITDIATTLADPAGRIGVNPGLIGQPTWNGARVSYAAPPDEYKTRNGFALPYTDVLYHRVNSQDPDKWTYRDWAGSVWRRDKNTVVVRWKPLSERDYLN